MSNSIQFRTSTARISHLSTVHRRDDVRILLKECASLATRFSHVSLVVFDGQGAATTAGVEIADLGKPPRNRLHRMIAGSIKVLRDPVIGRADVVHFHDPELLIVGLLLKLRGKKVIYDAHEDVPRQIENKHWIPVWLRGAIGVLVEEMENFVARRLNAVVAATPLICNRFRQVNPLATTVRNYPLLGEFLDVPLDRPNSRDVCYVGALTRERGIVELLDAIVVLGDVRLIACGPFQSAEFEAELRRHEGWRFVDYLGIVGRKDVAEILGKAQIGLVTLLPTPNQVEALPVKMFEYMAAGLPIIASDFPLWRNIVEENHCGLCVDPFSPIEIANAISTLLSDRELCLTMGHAGIDAIKHKLNWEFEVKKLIDLYIDIF